MMSISNDKCFICKTDCESQREATGRAIFDCPNCGMYSKYDTEESLKLRRMMFFYLRHKHHSINKKVIFTNDNVQSEDHQSCYVQYETLLEMYPKTVPEQIDMTLMNLSLFEIGQDVRHIRDTLSEILYIAGNIAELMLDLKYLKIKTIMKNIPEMRREIYILTADAWKRITELQETNDVMPQGFVAMWFDDEVKLAGEQILEAIRNNGYTPVRIDMKEHNNQIVPEIFYEIRRSQFVVADLTGHRNGVYYEAGYAQALNKQVIFTCRAADFEEKHFDVAQQNIIRWENEEELFERLKRRIEATVGNRS